jgi:hypothetical protein
MRCAIFFRGDSVNLFGGPTVILQIDNKLRAGLDAEKEAAVLAAWHDSGKVEG